MGYAQRISKAYRQCVDSISNTEAIECAWTEYNIQDGRLNQAYGMVMARLDANSKSKLRLMQKKWILIRDQRCKTPEPSGTLGR